MSTTVRKLKRPEDEVETVTYGQFVDDTTNTTPTNGTDGYGTTYGANIGLKQKQYSNTVAESGSTGVEPVVEEKVEEVVSTPTMTYEEYIASEKAREEQNRQQSLKDAEMYRERATADAQASYMQNMSTYGANAEQLARMGLTGGGYSDYLNAQAYAQKRSDIQTAEANKLKLENEAETTYSNNIAALNKNYFEYQDAKEQNKNAAYNSLLGYAMDADSGLTEDVIRSMGTSAGLSEAEITQVINTMNTAKANKEADKLKAQEEETAQEKKSFTLALTAELQNPNTYGNYTEAGLRALLKSKGYYTDEEIQGFVDIWNDAKKTHDITLEGSGTIGENEPFVMSDVIKDIQNGVYAPYTWEEIEEMLLQERNKGANITENDLKNAKSAYDAWITFKSGGISNKEYYDALNGDEKAQGIVNDVLNPDAIKKKAEDYGFTSDIIENVVNVNRDNTSWDIFGKYQGNKKQKDYANAIIADAKDGKIKEGQIVKLNYGTISGDKGFFVYVGNGNFVKLNISAKTRNLVKDKSIYLPDGYKFNWYGNIRKK